MSEATVTGFQRPPAEPDKLAAAWAAWSAGDEEPGRTMADLKIGGLDVILEDLANQSDTAKVMFEPWAGWERGRVTPADALAGLAEAGVADVISAITADD